MSNGKLQTPVYDFLFVNFQLLGDTFTVTLAANFGPSVFTPEVHETWQKFLNVVVAALGKQYH